jgi:hypothetical protein
VYLGTCYPNTTSSDGWTTLINQTPVVDATALNAAILAGQPGFAGARDISGVIGDAGVPTKFKVSLGAITPDGLHCNALGDKQPAFTIP